MLQLHRKHVIYRELTCTHMPSSIYIQKFNRRAKEVQPEEQEIWKHLCSTDMSEESDEEGSFVVHKPGYRSTGMWKIRLKTLYFRHCCQPSMPCTTPTYKLMTNEFSYDTTLHRLGVLPKWTGQKSRCKNPTTKTAKKIGYNQTLPTPSPPTERQLQMDASK